MLCIHFPSQAMAGVIIVLQDILAIPGIMDGRSSSFFRVLRLKKSVA